MVTIRRVRLPVCALFAISLLMLLPARPAASEPAMALFEVLGEAPFAGRLAAVGPTQLEVVPAGQTEARKLPLARVIEVRLPVDEDGPATPAPHRVTLMGGSVLKGTLSSPDEDGFQLAVGSAGSARLSFDVLRTFEVVPPKADPCLDLARAYKPDDEEDVVHLRRGDDRITGTLMDASANELVFEDARARTRRVAWRDVRVMHLNNDPLDAKLGIRGEVELVDGSRFVTAAPPVLAGSTLRFGLRSAPEAVFTVPMRRVHAIRYTGGAFVHASALSYESEWTSFYPGDPEVYDKQLKARNEARVDRQTDGCPLRLGGKTYRYGFGVHAKSVIRVPLDGAYATFQGVVGQDDSVKKLAAVKAADADVRVLGDGKVLWEKKGLTIASGVVKIGPLDVKGVKRLELVVDNGKNGQQGDFVTWGHPILVRK
ncbi:MAG: NPCBM/NEW2 domain-containing protein [Planctomycetota bacterium]|nr:NPCBM/NEW2 domain-containing protein [Planctomycetota bacterium]